MTLGQTIKKISRQKTAVAVLGLGLILNGCGIKSVRSIYGGTDLLGNVSYQVSDEYGSREMNENEYAKYATHHGIGKYDTPGPSPSENTRSILSYIYGPPNTIYLSDIFNHIKDFFSNTSNETKQIEKSNLQNSPLPVPMTPPTITPSKNYQNIAPPPNPGVYNPSH